MVWGAFTTFIGRVVSGDLQRGIMFGWNRLRRLVVGKRRDAAALGLALL